MTVAITGATGFIGSRVARALLDNGVRVIALTRHSPNDESAGLLWISSSQSVPALTAKFVEEGVVGVIHCASLFVKDHKPEELDQLVDSNLLLGLTVLEAATKSACQWFINTGTFWQHFHSRSYRPANLYAATKQAFEDLAQFYWRGSSLRFVTLKLNDTYGPGDPRPKIFSLLRKTLLSDNPLSLSAGRQKLNFLYIDDVVAAYLAVVKWVAEVPVSRARGVVFRASGSSTKTLRAVVRQFEEVCGQPLNVVWGALPYRSNEVMWPWAGGRRVPAWKPRVSLKAGIRAILEAEGWFSSAGPAQRSRD